MIFPIYRILCLFQWTKIRVKAVFFLKTLVFSAHSIHTASVSYPQTKSPSWTADGKWTVLVLHFSTPLDHSKSFHTTSHIQPFTKHFLFSMVFLFIKYFSSLTPHWTHISWRCGVWFFASRLMIRVGVQTTGCLIPGWADLPENKFYADFLKTKKLVWSWGGHTWWTRCNCCYYILIEILWQSVW